MTADSLKNVMNQMYLQIIYLIYKCNDDWALNNPQGLIYHKTKQTESCIFNIYV